MSNSSLYLLTFVAYGVLAIYFWRMQVKGGGDNLNHGVAGHLVLLPLALHAYLLYGNLFNPGLNLALVYAVSLIMWLSMLVYWIARFFYPIGSLQTLV